MCNCARFIYVRGEWTCVCCGSKRTKFDDGFTYENRTWVRVSNPKNSLADVMPHIQSKPSHQDLVFQLEKVLTTIEEVRREGESSTLIASYKLYHEVVEELRRRSFKVRQYNSGSCNISWD